MAARDHQPASRRTQRRAATKAAHVPLDDLLGWQASTAAVGARPSKGAALTKASLAAVSIGALISALTLPFLGAGAISLREANDYWDALPSQLPTQPLPQRSVILAADGTKIAEFYSENRVLVPLSQVPQVMQTALVSIEDSRFYEHGGVDVRGTTRALVNNLLGGATEGGSTITQQYVKQVLADAATTKQELAQVTSRTSYLRKLREAKYANTLEKTHTKDQILEGYLNIAYFGDGAYGVGTAARHYFNEPVTQLTLAQSALLAGLVKNPTGYDPTNHKAAAKKRRNVVLFRMHQLGKITTAQYEGALNSPIKLDLTSAANGCHASRYPFFCQYVKEQLESNPVFGQTPEAREQRLFRGGMTIHTTLNPKAQDIAQNAVDQALGRDNRIAANAVTVEPGTGKIVAMAVNRTFGTPKPGHFDKTEMLLPTLPAYQPGSNFKPFTLAAALERGYDPKTTWTAPAVYAPVGLNYPNSGFTNDGSADNGTMNAATALWRSSNTFYVHLESQVGVLNVANMAERLGITSLPRTGPNAITTKDASLTLGAYDVSPLEMAGAYATFAAQGTHCTPIAIDSITGPDGKQVNVPDADCHQAIPTSVANTVADIMQGTIDGPDPYRTGADESIGRPAAGKTGTTQNEATVWFSGYTPQYATSVEVSDPRGGFAYPLRGFYSYGHYIAVATGGSVAGPIWKSLMAGIHQGLPKTAFTPASGVTGFTNVIPDVRGLTLTQAYQVLSKAGFHVTLFNKTAAPDPLLTKDRVYSTDPAPGSSVGLGTQVTLTMTAGSNLHVELNATTPPTQTSAPIPTNGSLPGTNRTPIDTGGGIVTKADGSHATAQDH